MKIIKTGNKIKNREIQLFTFSHFLEFSSNFDQVFYGMDKLDNICDLEFNNKTEDWIITEIIRYRENLINFINVEFIKHVTQAFNISEFNIKENINLDYINNTQFDQRIWIKKIKRFYILILSNRYLFDKINIAGYSLSQIEHVIELASELEEMLPENKREKGI